MNALTQLSVRQIVALALVALITLYAVFATVQVHGLQLKLPLIGAIGPEGYKPKSERLAAELTEQADKYKKANEAALAKAKEQRARDERRFAQIAKEADDAKVQIAAVERDRTERFIDAGGVPDNRVCPSRPIASGPDRNASGVEAVRAETELDDANRVPDRGRPEFVRVTPSDVRICTENTILAETGRKWGLELEAGAEAED